MPEEDRATDTSEAPQSPRSGEIGLASDADFLGDQPTRDPDAWFALWQADHDLPIRTGRGGLVGWFVRLAKRLLRPIVRLGAAEVFERQRIFNLIVVETISEVREMRRRIADLDQHLKQVHSEHQAAIEAHAGRIEELDVRTAVGLRDVMAHNDALFARVDQKLDRYRRESRHLNARLGAIVAAQEAADTADTSTAVGTALREATYLSLEKRWRGDEAEIAERVAVYVPILARRGPGPVLDLGCGRGELLDVLAEADIGCQGVDANQAMVERCRDRGHEVAHGDLFEALRNAPEGHFGAIVSLHVIEHLAPDALELLARLAWSRLADGGMLVLETPSPLSIVASSRDFWIDPTHVHPVHPAWLDVVLREAGFELVERRDLHPYPESSRLPEIDLESIEAPARAVAHEVNQLRDRLDETLYGYRDYAMIATKSAIDRET